MPVCIVPENTIHLENIEIFRKIKTMIQPDFLILGFAHARQDPPPPRCPHVLQPDRHPRLQGQREAKEEANNSNIKRRGIRAGVVGPIFYVCIIQCNTIF